jgi:hypothetical protein
VSACNKASQSNTNTAKSSSSSGSSKAAESSDAATPKKVEKESAKEVSNETEKVKPQAGKGNIQGSVFYNSKPVEGIEVELCEKFARFLRGCSGKVYKAKTDKDGIFVVANAEPKEYEVLKAQVFKTNYFIFSQSGILEAKKYTVEADKTIFANDFNLFKNDLKTTNPKAGSKINANDGDLQWEAYPDASYYKVSLNGIYDEGFNGLLTTISGERTEETSFKTDKPLINGKYSLKVEAYNADDVKLSESSDDIKFTVIGGEDPKKPEK